MSEPAVEIQSASELDYEAYAAFQREAFRDTLARTGASDAHMTPEYYRWKYHPPDGRARIGRITSGGATLSSSAMLPLRIACGGDNVIGWHCVDVATLPAARRRGYLLATLRTLRDTVPPGELLFAFPNAGSIASFLKLGWAETGVVTTWINPCVRLVAGTDERIEQSSDFGPEHDIVGRRVKVNRPFVMRRPDYLGWRYTMHPHTTYHSFVYMAGRCEGICVVRKARAMGRDLALIMEIFGSSPRIQVALLSHAAAWARSEGLGMMAHMDTSLPVRTALRTLLVPVPSFLLPKRQVLVVLGGGELPTPLLAERWAVQTGDWDVF